MSQTKMAFGDTGELSIQVTLQISCYQKSTGRVRTHRKCQL